MHKTGSDAQQKKFDDNIVHSVVGLLMDVIQNLLCMNLGLDLLWSEDFLNNAFFVDKIGGAEDSDGLSAAGYLLAPAAEFLQKGGLGIGNKRELQTLGFCKLLLQCLLVLAHADNLVTGCSQLLLMCLQGASLGSASAALSCDHDSRLP